VVGDIVSTKGQRRDQRPDHRFVATQRARGMSWAAVAGLMGCTLKAAHKRYGGAEDVGRGGEVWARHAPEARALIALIEEEGLPTMVGAVYLVVLHKWLSAHAGPAERAALLAWEAPLVNTLTNQPPVIKSPPPAAEDWRVIGREVAADHGLTLDDIMGRARTARVCFARQAFWWRLWLLRRADGARRYGLAAIGRIASRDHTTVREGLTKHAMRNGLPLEGLK